ncbi:Os02g0697650, partial [Oryza sativa Japonica Group]
KRLPKHSSAHSQQVVSSAGARRPCSLQPHGTGLESARTPCFRTRQPEHLPSASRSLFLRNPRSWQPPPVSSHL